nr:hypothetical protein [Azospirillum halopraeferens]
MKFVDDFRDPARARALLSRIARLVERIVYSPLDALARRLPDREVVFFALGFETTMPATAASVLQAEREGIANFSLFCNHITVSPPLRALLEDPEMRFDGFVGPGHVSMVIGTEPYRFIAEEFHRPIVVAAVLNEMAESAGTGIRPEEAAIPCAPWCAASANGWGSTRSTSQTRGPPSPWSRPMRRRWRWPRGAPIPMVPRPASSAPSSTRRVDG